MKTSCCCFSGGHFSASENAFVGPCQNTEAVAKEVERRYNYVREEYNAANNTSYDFRLGPSLVSKYKRDIIPKLCTLVATIETTRQPSGASDDPVEACARCWEAKDPTNKWDLIKPLHEYIKNPKKQASFAMLRHHYEEELKKPREGGVKKKQPHPLECRPVGCKKAKKQATEQAVKQKDMKEQAEVFSRAVAQGLQQGRASDLAIKKESVVLMGELKKSLQEQNRISEVKNLASVMQYLDESQRKEVATEIFIAWQGRKK
jgi:hypothetical protein